MTTITPSLLLKSASDGTGGSGSGTSGTSGSSGTSGTSGSGAATNANGLVDDASQRFLTLLVTQLQNQDPLNPLDNAEITSQLAQLSTVTGVNKINDTLASLSTALDANQYMQSANLVGHDVVVSGNQIALADGTGKLAYAVKSAADDVTITIKDANGAVVRTIDAGPATADVHFLDWDGKADSGQSLADGKYTFTVTATAGKASVDTTALTVAHVDGLLPGTSGGQLQLGALGTIGLSQIVEIL
ncbi:MAG TPA: flagellar hook assembly protein FlgD [Casimicrobiaceae bacterium]|jgi:flagellar basal-body rod modification protein FlgD|nr:flagellar hook assembly protein FlgD [Casimicrobiaceae bacterium]